MKKPVFKNLMLPSVPLQGLSSEMEVGMKVVSIERFPFKQMDGAA